MRSKFPLLYVQVKSENPDAGFGEIAKIIAAKYKSLSQEERAQYDEQAKKDKKRYEEESKFIGSVCQ